MTFFGSLKIIPVSNYFGVGFISHIFLEDLAKQRGIYFTSGFNISGQIPSCPEALVFLLLYSLLFLLLDGAQIYVQFFTLWGQDHNHSKQLHYQARCSSMAEHSVNILTRALLQREGSTPIFLSYFMTKTKKLWSKGNVRFTCEKADHVV